MARKQATEAKTRTMIRTTTAPATQPDVVVIGGGPAGDRKGGQVTSG